MPAPDVLVDEGDPVTGSTGMPWRWAGSRRRRPGLTGTNGRISEDAVRVSLMRGERRVTRDQGDPLSAERRGSDRRQGERRLEHRRAGVHVQGAADQADLQQGVLLAQRLLCFGVAEITLQGGGVLADGADLHEVERAGGRTGVGRIGEHAQRAGRGGQAPCRGCVAASRGAAGHRDHQPQHRHPCEGSSIPVRHGQKSSGPDPAHHLGSDRRHPPVTSRSPDLHREPEPVPVTRSPGCGTVAASEQGREPWRTGPVDQDRAIMLLSPTPAPTVPPTAHRPSSHSGAPR